MVGYDACPHIGHLERLFGADPLLALRGPLTCAARRTNLQLLPAEKGPRGLRRQHFAVEQIAAGGAVRAALRAGWGVPAALGQQRVRHRFEGLDLADHAVAATVGTGAAAAAPDRVPNDAQRE